MRKIPLVKPHIPKLVEIEGDLRKMLDSGRLTNFGPFSKSLEKKVCRLIGIKHALCVSNATTGLLMLLSVLPKGSEVLVPSFTFLPTVQAVLWNSLRPVFVDIDAHTYTISPTIASSLVSAKTSAIVGVHAFGNPCAIRELEILAKDMKIKLFFDSAHAFGAKYHDSYLGGFGDAEVFSFSATKLLPCGEGGVITTNDDSIYEAILNRRNYGFTFGSYDCEQMGLNGKMPEFSAILGIHGINTIDERVRKRNEIAQEYIRGLSVLPGISFQSIEKDNISTYKDFTILVDSKEFGMDRLALRGEMGKRGVEAASYFSPPIHQMTYICELFGQTHLKVTEQVEQGIISLPIYSDMPGDEIRYVIRTLHCIHNNAS